VTEQHKGGGPTAGLSHPLGQHTERIRFISSSSSHGDLSNGVQETSRCARCGRARQCVGIAEHATEGDAPGRGANTSATAGQWGNHRRGALRPIGAGSNAASVVNGEINEVALDRDQWLRPSSAALMRLPGMSHSVARSRLVKISSHVASRPIGLPHIKIDLAPPVVESGVAEPGGGACSVVLRVSWEGGSGGGTVTLIGVISREASLESSAPVRSVGVVVSCNLGRGRGASCALTGLI
jgi:hypothetical protein